MQEYETRQRKTLLSFFESDHDRLHTIEDISSYLEGISRSAIYRNVNQMVAEGVIRRFQKDGERKFYYQYIGEGECHEHLHLKCDKCGKILHMESEAASAVMASIKSSFDFEIDKGSTILHGSCSVCK